MMTDDKIEQLLAADHSEPDHNLTRRIHQGIIREVYMRALLVVLVSAGQFVKEKTEKKGAYRLMTLYFSTHIVFLYNILMVVFPR